MIIQKLFWDGVETQKNHHRGVFWNHELRYGTNGKQIAKSGPLRGPQAISMILRFSHISFQQSHMFCLAMEQAMSQSTTFCAGNAAMCFLPYVLRSGRTRTAVRSSEGYVLRSQVNGICVGERRRTLQNVKNEACQKSCRRKAIRGENS